MITYARLLVPGDWFIPERLILAWDADPLGWRVRSHEYTQRNNYSTFVTTEDGTTWSERFAPDERVWITHREDH